MEKPIIEIKNIGKKYNITHQRGGYVTLRDVMMSIIKSPFSFIKTKAKQAVGLEKKEDFWALKDISFNVGKGEVIGIIGANGAGKSTLLKILSQITPPAEGEIILRGRVGSLLEVGTGFHPELTGRENIFLNGAILGMKKKEIAKKFDEIVEFSGIGKFLDTPVKYYSSGMYVRLAFSVAAHMEPDILIVDEVLAVGDAEFQKKCLGKMSEITKKEGRTILFVSHNMSAIQSLCPKCILLDKGKIVKSGKTEEVIAGYINRSLLGGEKSIFISPKKKGVPIQVTKMSIINEAGNIISRLEIRNDAILKVEYSVADKAAGTVVAAMISKDEVPLLYSYDADIDEALWSREKGDYKTTVVLPLSIFKEGTYKISIWLGSAKENLTDHNAFVYFTIVNTKENFSNHSYREDRPGFILKDLVWNTEKIREYDEK
jgi:lipopolysaccharide transport system ATP-binding protein